MNTVNDGGPAFPNVPSDPGYSQWDRGMSLRDWFAGQALAGLAAAGRQATPKSWGENCYALADAMISARGETK